MPDERTITLARNWVGWVGEQLAAQEMGVSVEILKGWLTQEPNQTTEREGREQAASKAKRYTPEEKREALRLVREIGLSKASRETGVSIASLIKWRQAQE